MEVRGRAEAGRPGTPESPSSARGSAPRCPGSPTPTRSTARSPTTDPHPGRARRRPRPRTAEKQALPDVDVSNIRTTESSVEFDVSRTGVPVMVKTSWYPNWEAEGADGPWRATPNFMVVVPTEQAREAHLHHVDGRLGRVGCSPSSAWRASAAWCGGGWRPADRTNRPSNLRERRHGIPAAAGTIPVPLSAVRTRGSRARLCARRHLQGL